MQVPHPCQHTLHQVWIPIFLFPIMINISLLFAFDQTLNYARWRICKIEIRPCTSHIAYVRVEVFGIFLRIFMGIFQVFFAIRIMAKCTSRHLFRYGGLNCAISIFFFKKSFLHAYSNCLSYISKFPFSSARTCTRKIMETDDKCLAWYKIV